MDSVIDFTVEQESSDICIISSDHKKLYFSKFVLINSSDHLKDLVIGYKAIKLNKKSNTLNDLFNLLLGHLFIKIDDLEDIASCINEYKLDIVRRMLGGNISGNLEKYDLTTMINVVITLELNIKNTVKNYLNSKAEHYKLDYDRLSYKILSWEKVVSRVILTEFQKKYKDDNKMKEQIILSVNPIYFDTDDYDTLVILLDFVGSAEPSVEINKIYNQVTASMLRLIKSYKDGTTIKTSGGNSPTTNSAPSVTPNTVNPIKSGGLAVRLPFTLSSSTPKMSVPQQVNKK